ncbi:MAG: zinc ABC transporter substrate-binding protein [Solobacterium sp.]|nr:zinc ABC transporter substrate-binding protein [Solobacterium sp.]
MKQRLLKLLTLTMLVLSLSGCTAERTTIAYTVYPIGFLTERLTGGAVNSYSIQDNTIVQRAQIREDYRSILSNAVVFMHIGQLEPYYSLYSSEISSLVPNELDLSVLNAVYDFHRYTEVNTDGEVTYLEGPYYRGDEFNLVDTDEKDLYLWTDPIAMLSMAKDIRQFLVTTYPDDAPIIEQNFEDLENDLINLDAQYQALSTANSVNQKSIRFVSMTASFGNWQKTYGFQVYPIILSKYGALPNEKQLALIEQRIKEDNVHYIVYEANMTEDMIELFDRVQDDLNLTRVELSNLSSLTAVEAEAGKDYLSIMYENLAVLETMAEAVTTQPTTDAVPEETGTEEPVDEEAPDATAAPEATPLS